MGGRGNSAERNHKGYLEDNKFDNLDEYDEEVLHDAQLTRSQPEQPKIHYTAKTVEGALKQAHNALQSGDDTKLKTSQERLTEMLRDGAFESAVKYSLEIRLQEINNAILKNEHEERRGRT